jgi:hypothetical protein
MSVDESASSRATLFFVVGYPLFSFGLSFWVTVAFGFLELHQTPVLSLVANIALLMSFFLFQQGLIETERIPLPKSNS